MLTTCEGGRPEPCLRPATVFGAGSLLTFPAFPETGTVEDSLNFWDVPEGGGVEKGREIRVSAVECSYHWTLFLGLQEERLGEREMQRQAASVTF